MRTTRMDIDKKKAQSLYFSKKQSFAIIYKENRAFSIHFIILSSHVLKATALLHPFFSSNPFLRSSYFHIVAIKMERDGEEGRNHDQSTSTSEIVEIPGEDGSKIADPETKDVYVAVGKNDLHVLEWALDHVVPPGSRVLLVHIFAPIAYIPTQVGRLSRSQLSQEQLKVYVREESNKRNHLLGKYISRCGESKAIEERRVEGRIHTETCTGILPCDSSL
ncbi:uncharacterized protein LOC127246091 isoform X2 [Andrographis paniculata]|uniref:uncharacterized protein LOC127246091 isoform X2 n=1 Tax=Andrographis paniculata TaxID=175694 RepID=UPI0021E8AB23|nr:uncharacterized protein LOC127246091 isoform X2 [Andrographis paniculata]